jgi:hypothetical protein
MREDDVDRRMQQYMAERANRPFGDHEAVSGKVLQPFSLAGQEAAENLLRKARRALDDGDHERARTLVDRAVRLPFDRHEQIAPAANAVHMDLFCLVADELEVSAEHDTEWLDAALVVLAAADTAGACDLRDVLRAIDHDYDLPSGDRQRLRSAIASVPERPELVDLDLGPAELHDHVVSVLRVISAYERALA